MVRKLHECPEPVLRWLFIWRSGFFHGFAASRMHEKQKFFRNPFETMIFLIFSRFEKKAAALSVYC
jgi:hypothetical protein